MVRIKAGPFAAFTGKIAIEQIVGRERTQRACHRQPVRNSVYRRRVNTTVGRQPQLQ